MSSWAILLDCGAGFSEMQWQSIVIHVNLSPPFVVGLQAWFGSSPSKVHITCKHCFFTFYYNYRHSTYNPMRYLLHIHSCKRFDIILQGRIQGGWIGWISTPHFSVKKNSKCHFIWNRKYLKKEKLALAHVWLLLRHVSSSAATFRAKVRKEAIWQRLAYSVLSG